jgi:predicted nucleic acid-binding protein
MRILIDTNVIIHLEDDHLLERSFSRFSRLALRENTLVVHPLSKEDIYTGIIEEGRR